MGSGEVGFEDAKLNSLPQDIVCRYFLVVSNLGLHCLISCTRNDPTPHIFINFNLCSKLACPITLWQSLACPVVEKRDFRGKARDVSSTGDSRKGESRSALMHLLSLNFVPWHVIFSA
jgi:hypothetical protein